MKGATKKKRGRPRLKAGEDPTPSPIQPPTNGACKEQLFKCDDCISQYVMIEMQEHLAATGHTGYEPVEQNAELFSEPQPIFRSLRVSLTLEEQHSLNAEAAVLAMKLVEQDEIFKNARTAIKELEQEQATLVGKLRAQYKMAEVECEWRIDVDEQNAKNLHRKDTNEIVETRALSEEDRAQELARVQAANQQQEKAAEATA